MRNTTGLRTYLLAALAGGSLATTACGSADNDVFTGTGGGNSGGASSGGASSGGASSGGTSSGGTSSGGASSGGASSGGASSGGASSGGSSSGGASSGGASSGGASSGGAGGTGGSTLTTIGTVNCKQCQGAQWVSCWDPGTVPLKPGVPPTKGCPEPNQINPKYELCPGVYMIYSKPGVVPGNGKCCYNTYDGCAIGRPFLVDGEQRIAALRSGDDWCEKFETSASDTQINAATREALSNAWLDDASLEHASVAAFARLTLELMELGAPPELVAASQVASLDEVRHAQACFGLAERFGNQATTAAGLSMNNALSGTTIVELARTTFLEGCVGETLAALTASEARLGATDHRVLRVLGEVEKDEASHAALAWKIVRWALSLGGVEVRHAVEQAFTEALDTELSRVVDELPESVDEETWKAMGRLSPRETKTLRIQGMREVVEPCLASLLAKDKVSATRLQA